MLEFAGFKIKPIFAWYDLWIGVYYDQKGRKLYILPLPSIGIVIEFPFNIIMTTVIKNEPSTEVRTFTNLRDARLYVMSRIGDGPTTDNYRIFSKDRNIKIIVTGCDVKELFPNVILFNKESLSNGQPS